MAKTKKKSAPKLPTMRSVELAGGEVWNFDNGENVRVLCRSGFGPRWEITSFKATDIRAGVYILDDIRGPLLVVKS